MPSGAFFWFHGVIISNESQKNYQKLATGKHPNRGMIIDELTSNRKLVGRFVEANLPSPIWKK